MISSIAQSMALAERLEDKETISKHHVRSSHCYGVLQITEASLRSKGLSYHIRHWADFVLLHHYHAFALTLQGYDLVSRSQAHHCSTSWQWHS